MRYNNLRTESNAFDWLITPNIKTVCDVLLDDFKDFFLKENLIIENDSGEMLNVRDTKTEFLSLHDFKNTGDFDAEYDRFVVTYKKRINRFKKLIKTKQSILFIRTNITNGDMKYLNELKKLNRNAKIEFLIINLVDTDKIKKLPCTYEGFHIYEISYYPDVSYNQWIGNCAHWKDVLSQFSLVGYRNMFIDNLKNAKKEKELVIWGFGGAGKKIVTQLLAKDINI